MKPLTLRSRIRLWFVLLAVALVAAAGVATIAVTDRLRAADRDRHLLALAETLGQFLEWDEDEVELDAEGSAAHAFGADAKPPREFAILELRTGTPAENGTSAGGSVLAATYQSAVSEVSLPDEHGDEPRPPPEHFDVLVGGRAMRACAVYVWVGPDREVRAWLRHHGREIPYAPVVVIVAEAEPEGQTLAETQLVAIAIVLPFALLGALGCGVLLARRIAAPIQRMTGAAAAIERDLDAPKVPEPGSADEIDQLARTLNLAFGRLRDTLDRQRRFTADAAHELRTPITVVRTQAEVALRNPKASGEARETLEAVLGAAIRMQDLVDALLMLARIDGGHDSGSHDRVDLGKLARQAVEEARDSAGSRYHGIEVERASSDGTACVRGDARQLRVIIDNLLGNAITHGNDGIDTDGDAHVRVRVRRAGDAVELRVQDDGPGIPAADVERVFERFHRVDESRSRASGGAGLGLAIVKAIVEDHGGSVVIDSHTGDTDHGTTVTVHLPADGAASDIEEPRSGG